MKLIDNLTLNSTITNPTTREMEFVSSRDPINKSLAADHGS
jgi:hypothetical protein